MIVNYDRETHLFLTGLGAGLAFALIGHWSPRAVPGWMWVLLWLVWFAILALSLLVEVALLVDRRRQRKGKR